MTRRESSSGQHTSQSANGMEIGMSAASFPRNDSLKKNSMHANTWLESDSQLLERKQTENLHAVLDWEVLCSS